MDFVEMFHDEIHRRAYWHVRNNSFYSTVRVDPEDVGQAALLWLLEHPEYQVLSGVPYAISEGLRAEMYVKGFARVRRTPKSESRLWLRVAANSKSFVPAAQCEDAMVTLIDLAHHHTQLPGVQRNRQKKKGKWYDYWRVGTRNFPCLMTANLYVAEIGIR